MKDPIGCDTVIAIVLIGVMCFFCGGGCAAQTTREQIQSEAIRAHVAEYYLDQNNERKFRWKECK